jgi:hypothetical protein
VTYSLDPARKTARALEAEFRKYGPGVLAHAHENGFIELHLNAEVAEWLLRLFMEMEG